MNFKNSEIQAKLKSIEFRGPDNYEMKTFNKVKLAHLRLSILDLDSRSNQPFSYKNLSISYNGEIYNFNDLKKELANIGYTFYTESDTEVLLIGYYEWGERVLDKLNGMFAFVIYDSIKDTIFCARDRLGVKPFYYKYLDNKFEICSQIQPLLDSNNKLSEIAISVYLDCGYVPSPFSIFENIFKLEPGSKMIIDLTKKAILIDKYWDIKKTETLKISYNDAKNKLHELLVDATRIRMQSDVPLGTFLSGGIDSALVTSIAASISERKVSSYTIGFNEKRFDESSTSTAFAKALKTKHKVKHLVTNDLLDLIPKLIEVYDEPFADSSALPSLLLCKNTKEDVTVALSGDGGDESFMGYRNFDYLSNKIQVNKLPKWCRAAMARLPLDYIFRYNKARLKSLFKSSTDGFTENIFISFKTLQKKDLKTKWFSHYENYKLKSNNPYQKMADLNIKLWLENDSNVKVDRASMAYSMEVRSPFLDYRVIEFARSLPVGYRYYKGNKKKILKDILSEYLPKHLFDLPKKGFGIPLFNWLQGDLKENVLKELNDEFLLRVPNLNVKLFKHQLNQFYQNKIDHSSNIWKLYILALWFKRYYKQEDL
ncbi:asparagine synthase (glutamine-hydrolyzing) [Croceibacter atlanticus]|uniref:asparagine synthase (glutamine-hydrolyzing) n=1 Tax=Croceibacter atlanticus (strain ATCC BAA-628 / JCM 21780 / CIP 108009 / IAM 15332 / KCTC 12090 / HTCC2559) TaxID=216432 RepID=A3UAX7_CROAH|nr:asparagine synthase (glutamine-hydrolyzing) [Croceibacter atlanticus]EAP86963.1 probable asparagine synthase, glutamine-hydrolyzing [Croceibacter atlanticus HTCC2559]